MIKDGNSKQELPQPSASQEEEKEDALPEEFKGVKPEMIERNIRRLELDMEAEILTIKARYTDKIAHLQNILRIANGKQDQKES